MCAFQLTWEHKKRCTARRAMRPRIIRLLLQLPSSHPHTSPSLFSGSRDTMDAASTAVGLIGTSIKVVKFIKNTIDEIRDAPVTLKNLQRRVVAVEMLMEELQGSQLQSLFRSSRDVSVLEDLASQAKSCVGEIEGFVEKMQRKGKGGEMTIAKVKWLLKEKNVEALSSPA